MVEVATGALDARAHDERYERLERALLADLVHNGSAVTEDDVRRELARAYERFLDVRVHTYVPILAERNVRAALRAAGHG